MNGRRPACRSRARCSSTIRTTRRSTNTWTTSSSSARTSWWRRSFPRPHPARLAASRDVYLPAGSDWYEFRDNEAAIGAPIAGGQTLRGVRAGLDQVPIYVREGAILPMRSRVEQYVGELKENPLDIHVYPGPDSDYLLYQDDGISTRAEKDEAFRMTRISRRAVSGGTSIRLERLHDRYTPPEPFVLIRLLGTERPTSVNAGRVESPAARLGHGTRSDAGRGLSWDERSA